MATTPDGQGYWLVAADGGVFSFGDAAFHGSRGGVYLNQPIVAMAATPDGRGYWLVARDGGIFNFGDAGFHGSAGSIRLSQPVVGIAVDLTTGGYWLAAADGGVFSFDAPFRGSLGAVTRPKSPFAAISASPHGNGYRLAGAYGGVVGYGDALPYGNASRAAPGILRCLSSQITPTVAGGVNSGVHKAQQVQLTNTSAAPCTLDGYPGLSLLKSTGAYAPVTTTYGAQYPYADPGPSLVTLRAGQSASFDLGSARAVAAGETASEVAGRVAVTLPDGTRPVYFGDTVIAYPPSAPGGPFHVGVNAIA